MEHQHHSKTPAKTAVPDSLSNQKIATKNQNTEATKTYTCSIHPEVISDKPGKCPKCGMELIEKK